MIQIVYASAAVHPFSEAALETLLRKSRSRNRFYNVTGLLLYESGSFLQVLEGPEEGVESIFASIGRDPRHSNTKVFNRQVVHAREFGEWEMSFVNASRPGSRPEGFMDSRQALPRFAAGATAAKRYLRFFNEGLCRQTV